jgi:hypothetical protein
MLQESSNSSGAAMAGRKNGGQSKWWKEACPVTRRILRMPKGRECIGGIRTAAVGTGETVLGQLTVTGRCECDLCMDGEAGEGPTKEGTEASVAGFQHKKNGWNPMPGEEVWVAWRLIEVEGKPDMMWRRARMIGIGYISSMHDICRGSVPVDIEFLDLADGQNTSDTVERYRLYPVGLVTKDARGS